ncbi:hypothetical protein [Pectobacterium peruviense]|uniref:Uncharacterized protein n=1 Tax=Pectobacterium peruviense TaxID=2066479 RepID=A0ABX4SAN3_9GAMM|nr:hypothetical protein [Pectobacterium peruviense]KML70783.1 hypothetical protein G033_02295 [Pectobacterium peruviense]PKX82690.1 hypothetical protein A0G02_13185 [Pectobacterium peruviense]PKX87144.1 hypothetical protein A0G03_06770 [Pectobacterium peruviense]
MIESAEEFIALRSSDIKSEYDRSAMEEAPLDVWLDVLKKYPSYGRWVAHNKTVPLEILEALCAFDEMTRACVASKRKLSYALFDRLSRDANRTVRVAIAANRKAPADILERLLADTDEGVIRIARYNVNER